MPNRTQSHYLLALLTFLSFATLGSACHNEPPERIDAEAFDQTCDTARD
ncbi:hypothetical protein [Persicimonas caeni]|nr:hypothetical protein [Persicimonas caeni]